MQVGKKIRRKLQRMLIPDPRLDIHSLDSIKPAGRKRKSRGIAFYSSAPNIGNYLPELGIMEMLGERLDGWNIHDRNIDYEFVNENYEYAVVGGAGLLHPVFVPFWESFSRKARLPFVVWGVGACFPDGSGAREAMPHDALRRVSESALAINVRDQITADLFTRDDVSIAPCPTVVALEEHAKNRQGNGSGVLFSSHDELVGDAETRRITQAIESIDPSYRFTDNTQRFRRSMMSIIEKLYMPSETVISTRLHGAIIAYSLGIPYIALARDEKIRQFVQLFGNGVVIEDVDKIVPAYVERESIDMGEVQRDTVREVGALMKKRIADAVAG